MVKKKSLSEVRRQLQTWFLVGMPILAIVGAGLMPLPVGLRQVLIGVVLFWFQISLMLGVF